MFDGKKWRVLVKRRTGVANERMIFRADLFAQVLHQSGFADAGFVEWDGGAGSGDIKAGQWTGSTSDYDVCFNVAKNGASLTAKGSRCDDGDALDIDFDRGLKGNCGDKDGNMN